jgi:uncharacterized protein
VRRGIPKKDPTGWPIRSLLEERAKTVQAMRSLTDNPEGDGGDLSDEQERRFDQHKGELATVEVIRSGAFTETLADGHDIVALVDHDRGKLLGGGRNGSLRLAEARQGLMCEIDVPGSLGNDVLSPASRGDLAGMSFAFRTRPGGERWERRQRTLTAVDLVEVSVIHSFPAYAATEVHARSGAPLRLLSARRWLETC